MSAGWDVGRSGEGPPLLLLHSGFGTWREWRRLLPVLGEEHQVLAPTLPGSYGGPPLSVRDRSYLQAHADYAESVLDEAGVAGLVPIVGSSHGAVTALELAARGRASQVIALAPPWMTLREMLSIAALAFGGMLPFRIGRRFEQPVWRATPRMLRAAAGGSLFHFRPGEVQMSDEDLLATIRSLRDFPFPELFPDGLRQPLLPDCRRIACPVLLVWGTRDRAVSWSAIEHWREALPYSELHTLPGLPHAPHASHPDRVAALILDSLR